MGKACLHQAPLADSLSDIILILVVAPLSARSLRGLKTRTRHHQIDAKTLNIFCAVLIVVADSIQVTSILAVSTS
jgi:hypothetical protein